MNRLAATNSLCAIVGLILILATLPLNGCAMNEKAQSEGQWQQMNPNYKPTIPPDPRPQWGIFNSPDY
jgi:hypothetical protein